MLNFIPLGNIKKTQIFYIFREHEREYWLEMGSTTTILVRAAQCDLNLMPEMSIVQSYNKTIGE